MIYKQATTDMSREEWLEQRKKTIGGSDAAAVLGLSKYTSPYAIWCEKTGKLIAKDRGPQEPLRLGRDLEEYVRHRWTEVTGKALEPDPNFWYNTDNPFAHGNIDGLEVGEDAGFEAKTTASYDIYHQCREGSYPEAWKVQMLHYMMVTGKQKWYLGVLCFGKGFYCFELERDEAQIAALAEQERQFWQHVESGTPPAADGSDSTTDALKAVLGDSTAGKTVELDPVGTHVTEYVVLEEKIRGLQTRQAEHRNAIMAYMGDGEKGTYGDVTVHFKTRRSSIFDRKAFEAANGKIGAMYFKQCDSRPFKVSVRK